LIKNTIKLDKLNFFGYHGINKDEIKNGQNFVLDITINYKFSDNINDDIENVIDYMKLYTVIKDSFQSQRFNLLESLGNKMLNDIKSNFKSIFYIKLNIRKPAISIDNNQDFINVEVEYIE